MSESKDYFLPKNALSKNDVAFGLDWKECVAVMLSILIAFGLFYLSGVVIQSKGRAVVCLFIPIVTFNFLKPDPISKVSPYKQFKDHKAFKKTQKKYYYVYGSGGDDSAEI